MTYAKTLAWLDEVAKVGSKLGLSRTFELLNIMKNPQNRLKFVHIAGTNGKGSVAACIARVLYEAGYKTGLYTSPHLVKINERFNVDGADIEDDVFAELITGVREAALKMGEEASQFEILTAAAFEYFYNSGCDIVVLETGLGGRLDSTNVISMPEAEVITTIDMDHVNELGDTIEEIAAEKAGIIKEKTDVVIDGRNSRVMRLFKDICAQRGCMLHISRPDEIENLKTGINFTEFDYKGIKGIKLQLLGLYQPGNAALAIDALNVLAQKGFKITDDIIKKGLLNVRWHARFEFLSKDPYFIIDGSHNPAGVRETLKSFKVYFPGKKIRFILGILSDKNINEIINDIKNYACEIAVITPPSERACNADEMIGIIKNICDIKTAAFYAISDAVRYMIFTAVSDDIICATGSLYSAGEIKHQFELAVQNL